MDGGTASLVAIQGTLTVEANAILTDQGFLLLFTSDATMIVSGLVEIVGSGSTYMHVGANIIVNPSGVLSDHDAITIGAGATLDVYGKLTEGVGGAGGFRHSCHRTGRFLEHLRVGYH